MNGTTTDPVLRSIINRFDLLVNTIRAERGDPRIVSFAAREIGKEGHGTCSRLSAVWHIGGRNHGVGVDYYNQGKINIMAWAPGHEYRVSIWTKELKYHTLLLAACTVGILPEKE